MMKPKRWNPNTILVDCDGVLLNWEYAFLIWMEGHGHKVKEGMELEYNLEKRYDLPEKQTYDMIARFNESAAIGFLPPLRDATFYVKRLHEEYGFVFHCITSVSSDENAQRLRRMNLEKMFGDTVFERIICLDLDAPKAIPLEEYKNTGFYWIEDKVANIEAGIQAGLRPIMMEHGYNMLHQFNHPVKVVTNWKEIYEYIVK